MASLVSLTCGTRTRDTPPTTTAALPSASATPTTDSQKCRVSTLEIDVSWTPASTSEAAPAAAVAIHLPVDRYWSTPASVWVLSASTRWAEAEAVGGAAAGGGVGAGPGNLLQP